VAPDTCEVVLIAESNAVTPKVAKQVQVLCWVPLSPDFHDKACHVKATWGWRCDILLFMSTENGESILLQHVCKSLS
jgi:glycoprotein-N-acetylgalactosamine 3-beta-galactosyltransferase